MRVSFSQFEVLKGPPDHDLDCVRFGGRLGTVLLAIDGMAFVALDCGATYILKGVELSLLSWIPTRDQFVSAIGLEEPVRDVDPWIPAEGDVVEFIATEADHVRAACQQYPQGIIRYLEFVNILGESQDVPSAFLVRWMTFSPWRPYRFEIGDPNIRLVRRAAK